MAAISEPTYIKNEKTNKQIEMCVVMYTVYTHAGVQPSTMKKQ